MDHNKTVGLLYFTAPGTSTHVLAHMSSQGLSAPLYFNRQHRLMYLYGSGPLQIYLRSHCSQNLVQSVPGQQYSTFKITMKTKHCTTRIPFPGGRREPTHPTEGTLLILLWRGTPGRTRPWLCTLLRPFDLPECRVVLPFLKSFSSWGEILTCRTRGSRTNPRVRAGDCRCDLLHHPDTQDLQQVAGFWSYFCFL